MAQQLANNNNIAKIIVGDFSASAPTLCDLHAMVR